MGRIFRAFVWMRWRVLVNSLELTGSRDMIERFSIAAGRLGPIVAMILLIPSSLALLVLGMAAGFGTATGSMLLPLQTLRYLMFFALALTILGPMVLPSRDGGSVTRLLLLPIPRSALYMAQVAGALADPWILLMVPTLAGVAIGMAVGLSVAGVILATAAGAAFLLFVLGMASLASSVIHLLLRDRRRGDLVMLLLVLVLPLLAIGPQLFFMDQRSATRKLTRAERQARPPTPVERAAQRVLPYVPSEMYYRSAKQAPAPAEAAWPLAQLAIAALGVQMAGYAAYRRVLDMPANQGLRRAGAFGGLWNRVIPGLSAAASAVAFTQLRLALRSPRGRATIGTPLVMPILFAALTSRGNMSFPGMQMHYGLGLAGFGCLSAVMVLLPLSVNQFAIDKAGFTRFMLSPLGIDELLMGKAVGNLLIIAGPLLFCFFFPMLAFPGAGGAAPWLQLALALVATIVLHAPVAAALSALFPKDVDLNSIGSGSNAHQGAGLLGMLALVLAAAPSALLAFVAIGWLHRPELTSLFLLAWCAIAIALSWLLFKPVRRLVASRCETLAQYG